MKYIPAPYQSIAGYCSTTAVVCEYVYKNVHKVTNIGMWLITRSVEVGKVSPVLLAASGTGACHKSPSQERESCQVGPKDAIWPMHSCGNTDRKDCSWPNFWANLASFSLRAAVRGEAHRCQKLATCFRGAEAAAAPPSRSRVGEPACAEFPEELPS